MVTWQYAPDVWMSSTVSTDIEKRMLYDATVYILYIGTEKCV